MPSKFLNINTDNTLGGSSASDTAVPSQKAVKEYVDNNTAPAGSYVTTNTTQTITGQKTFLRTESQFQDSVARFVSTYNSSSAGWRGRVIIGAKDYTFLIGTYNSMAAIGGHKFSDSSTESGAEWSDIYFQPDGNKAVYFGGYSWRQNSGWFKVQNSGSNTGGTVQVNIGSISSANWKNVAYKGENISDFNNDSGFITGISYSMVTTALGFTPYDASNPSGYQANVIETVKVNGTALTPSNKEVDITIPTVNNSTITIKQGGTTKGSFTTNQASGSTIELDAGGSVTPTDVITAMQSITGYDSTKKQILINDQGTFKWIEAGYIE